MKFRQHLTYSLTVVLASVLCGLPEAVQAQEPSQQPTQQNQQTQQPANPGVTVDPSQGPLAPPATSEQPPANNQQEETILPDKPTPQTAPVQQQQREPLGAATAGSVRTTGGGASRPAGNAIAPAKQHQVRSFLIKFGAIAAAGVAVGTVYALSKGTPSVPPNSGR